MGPLRAATLLLLGLLVLVFAAGEASAVVAPAQLLAPEYTSTTLSPSVAVASPGTPITVTATVLDIGVTPTYPTGSVSWSDGGAGGSFASASCTLSQVAPHGGKCSVSYSPATGSIGKTVTLSAAYLGDAGHLGSAGQSILSIYAASSITITPKSLSLVSGRSVTFMVNVTDTNSTAPTPPQGTLAWNDGGAGGTFSAPTCTLTSTTNSSAGCSVKYTAPSPVTAPETVTVNATYSGDNVHAPRTVTASLSVTPAQVPVTVSFMIMGSGAGATPPTFTYTFANRTQTAALTAAPTSYQVDVDTRWFVPNQLGNSSGGAAWNLVGGAQGLVSYSFGTQSGGTSMIFVYYHQYLVTLGYKVVGGTAGASIPPFVTYTSFGVTRQTGAPGQTWVDVGTPYSYPAELPGSLGDVRWIAQNASDTAQNVNGTAAGPADLSVTYYHQYRLSASFSIGSDQGGLGTPSMYYEFMGGKLNASLSSLGSKTWFDAGSQYSLTDPLVGSNSTVRWSAGDSSSAVVTDSNITVAYYRQFAIATSFTIADGSSPSHLVNGVSKPVLATILGVAAGRDVTISLGVGAGAQTVWLDGGTPYSFSGVLFALPGERWVASGDLNGTATVGGEMSQTYYHQYLVDLSYQGSRGPPTSFLDFTSLGTPTKAPLPAVGSTIWADAGTSVAVQGSPAGERWFASGAQNGVVTAANESFTYYHQYQVDVSLKVAGGGLPAQTSMTGTSAGQPFTTLLGTQTVTVWLDDGSSYFVPQKLLQLADERWIATANLTGTATSPASVTQTYYHQDLLNLSSSGAPPTPQPNVSYVSLGVEVNSPLGPASSPAWVDSGAGFTVQNVLNGVSGERWYSDLAGGNVTAPVQATATYFHQYLLTYTYTPVGGTMAVPPVLKAVEAGSSGLASLTNQTGHLWLDAGTHWQAALAAGLQVQSGERWVNSQPSDGTIDGPVSLHLSYFHQFLLTTGSSAPSGGKVSPGGWYNASSVVTIQAAPGQGWALGGWVGAYSGTNATLSVSVASPMNETAVFEPGLTIVSSSGGSVKYTTGASVDGVGPGRSVQTFVPGKGQVTLEAHASFPYQFVKWTGVEGQGSSLLTLNVNDPTVIQATFAPSYLDLIGLPALVFASATTLYLTRHLLMASGRQVLRNFRARKKDLEN
jgi:Divergent InlB B-repeat domain